VRTGEEPERSSVCFPWGFADALRGSGVGAPLVVLKHRADPDRAETKT